jgi:hypothetical protein
MKVFHRLPRRCCPLAAVLVASLGIGLLAWRDHRWIDEMGHLGAGGHAWASGDFQLYKVNPPLVRLLGSVPLVFSGYPLRADLAFSDVRLEEVAAFRDRQSVRLEWHCGSALQRELGVNFHWFLFLGRMVLLPFFLGTSLVLWLWTRTLYDDRAAALAVFAWCSLPEVLNWSTRITPDSATSFSWLLVWFCAWRCIEMPSLPATVVTGLAWGVSLCIKSSALFLPGLMFVAWVAHRSIRGRQSSWLLCSDACRAAIVACIGLVFLATAYGWREVGSTLQEYRFVSTPLNGGTPTLQNRFFDTWLGAIPVPLPRLFLEGIDLQKAHFDQGGACYFAGRSSEKGWWWFYLAAAPLKAPVGSLGLFAMGLYYAIFRSPRRLDRRRCADAVFLLLPSVLLFVLVSSQTGHTRNLRYLLPCYPFVVALLAGILRTAPHPRVLVALLALSAAECVTAYPNMFNFANWFAGGPKASYYWFPGSSHDAGVEELAVGRWLASQPEMLPAAVSCSNSYYQVLGLSLARPGVQPRCYVFSRREAADMGLVHIKPLAEIGSAYLVFPADLPVVRGVTVHGPVWEKIKL